VATGAARRLNQLLGLEPDRKRLSRSVSAMCVVAIDAARLGSGRERAVGIW